MGEMFECICVPLAATCGQHLCSVRYPCVIVRVSDLDMAGQGLGLVQKVVFRANLFLLACKACMLSAWRLRGQRD